MIFGVLAMIAVIVSGVALARPGTPVITIKEMSGYAAPVPTSEGNAPAGHAGPPVTQAGAVVWTFAVGHDNGAHEYL